MSVFPSQPSNLIQHAFLILQFLQVRNLGVVYLAPLAHGFSPGFDEVLAKVTVSSGGSSEGGYTSKLTPAVVGRIQFITGCGTGGLISSLAVGQRFL